MRLSSKIAYVALLASGIILTLLYSVIYILTVFPVYEC